MPPVRGQPGPAQNGGFGLQSASHDQRVPLEGRGRDTVNRVDHTAYHQGGIKDFPQWQQVVGACRLIISIGPSFPRGVGHWLKAEARLTARSILGYSAQNKASCDYRWGFSEKSPLQIGGEAFRCCPDERQGAPGTSKGLKNMKCGDCRIIRVYGKRRKSCVSRSSLSLSWS